MQGSIVCSWLFELAGKALEEDLKLDSINDYVQYCYEGKCGIYAAIVLDTLAPVLSALLFTRFKLRQEEISFYVKMLAALR